jgi:protein involved in polysaccharide export with SLBB domain
MSRLSSLVASALLVVAAGCSLPGGPPLQEAAGEINATLASRSLVVAPGDLLRVRFRLESQYDQEVTVGPDGTADFLDVGSVFVSGLESPAVVERLKSSYAALAPNAEISLQVAEAVRTVTVTGEVIAPGELVVGPDQRLTLVEAIGQAGGFRKQSAWLSNLMLLRWDAKTQKQVWWRLDARPKHWQSEDPIYLQAFDVIYVPNTNVDHTAIIIENFVRRMLPLPVPVAL